jgi:prevent-host-death family protein
MATRTYTATDARRQLAVVLEQIDAGDRIIVTRHGRTIAAIIGTDDLLLLEAKSEVREEQKAAVAAGKQLSFPYTTQSSLLFDLPKVDANGTPVTDEE